MTELDKLQLNIYTSSPNYRIEYSGDRKDCVAIYVSSNNIFFPHNVETFKKAVVEKDRYEWTRMKVKRAQKHIFLRDIYKQWYASGINSRLDNLDKVINWLRDEVKGYSSIICLGSSAGGTVASIIGTKLKADTILNFNGQWDVYDNIERDDTIISPVLKRMIDNGNEGVRFFNIVRPEFDYHHIFYLVSTRSPWDVKQLKLIKDFKNIHIVRFRNSHHGIPFLKCSLPIVMNMTFEELCRLEMKEHWPIFFEMQTAGILKTIKFLAKMLKNKILK